jgi:hypothetical protein
MAMQKTIDVVDGNLLPELFRKRGSKVDVLKEVKQVQLQVLELQASLRKSGDE